MQNDMVSMDPSSNEKLMFYLCSLFLLSQNKMYDDLDKISVGCLREEPDNGSKAIITTDKQLPFKGLEDGFDVEGHDEASSMEDMNLLTKLVKEKNSLVTYGEKFHYGCDNDVIGVLEKAWNGGEGSRDFVWRFMSSRGWSLRKHQRKASLETSGELGSWV
ncbi:hypothetical protein BDN71DRAFT_1430409 [Pleurotus eryngii]|uniref:Uncharacterized protein n=1 Tax=Pleurotus eryngii TaxID=5323 RepID=A0A9P6A2I7_PLEER|nr:hypothetical protein BDN71DRAFT_1430409 [Pleurotus eryngii]